ncbi:hypothetical protein [Oscillatoria sp. FACHB-1406]|uniref:hypothetical protein n=1 Tax=Oscillatoria sp. FACHB-1406 TaxID=2692846 RepID=UPI0018F01056|nr:hypothetical protein [Oscillatoria sp. FACHB-1406]
MGDTIIGAIASIPFLLSGTSTLAAPNFNLLLSSTQGTIQPRSVCPADLETLTQLMLRDLPGYANRVLRRSDILDVPNDNYTFSVILAGRAEYEPLDLSTIPQSQIEQIQDPNPPKQVFFTTLEQTFTAQKSSSRQNYHWLFLVKGESGWQPILLFTQFGSSDSKKFPTPPRETSNGIVGQAVKLWLRDCRAGSLR